MDLSDLDAAAAERRAEREAATSTGVESRGSRRRRHHRRGSPRSGSRVGRSEFNRRVQLVLFVALLLLGIAVVFRACSSGARRVEPEIMTPTGQASVDGHVELLIEN